MHCRFLVTLPLNEADNPAEAMNYVENELLDNGFIGCGEQGCCEYDDNTGEYDTCSTCENNPFGCGMSDWFVI